MTKGARVIFLFRHKIVPLLTLAFCLFAYAEQAWPLFHTASPTTTGWENPLWTGAPSFEADVPPLVDGLMDYVGLSALRITGSEIHVDDFHAGLELAGWMVTPRPGRPWFAIDFPYATLHNTEHQYTFIGTIIRRPDIAQLHATPSMDSGFRFRLDLTELRPGRYSLRVKRRHGSFVPPLVIVRH